MATEHLTSSKTKRTRASVPMRKGYLRWRGHDPLSIAPCWGCPQRQGSDFVTPKEERI